MLIFVCIILVILKWREWVVSRLGIGLHRNFLFVSGLDYFICLFLFLFCARSVTHVVLTCAMYLLSPLIRPVLFHVPHLFHVADLTCISALRVQMRNKSNTFLKGGPCASHAQHAHSIWILFLQCTWEWAGTGSVRCGMQHLLRTYAYTLSLICSENDRHCHSISQKKLSLAHHGIKSYLALPLRNGLV